MSDRIPTSRKTPRWVERELTHSRHVIANAKVVVTFSAALAATFASAALDKNTSNWDEWAVRLMLANLGVTLIVILLHSGHHRGELDHDPARWIAMTAYSLMILQVALSVATIVAAIGGKRGDLGGLVPGF